MNPVSSNPLMFILEADPEKYIRTPSAAIVAVVKAFEGVAAFLCCLRMLDVLRQLVTERTALPPIEYFKSLAPGELTLLLLPETLRAPDGALWTVLSCAAALCILAELVCFVIEAVAALYLRFALGGAKLFQSTRAVVSTASVVLALCMTASCVLPIQDWIRGGIRFDDSLRPILVPAGCALLLWLHVIYNRDAATVLSAVEYEIRLGFKQTELKKLRLGRHALLLCLCFAAGAAALCVFADWRMRSVWLLALLGCKYFAAFRSWRVFRRCHR